MKERRAYIVVTLWLVVVAALASSLVTLFLMNRGGGVHIVSDEQYATLARYARLDAVRETLETEYYKEVDSETLMNGAIKGMMSSLDDPYTFYYTTEEMQSSQDRSNGAYHGIGIIVKLDDGKLFVERVYNGSTALAAGVQEGDEIIAIDDMSIAESSDKMNDAVERIQGEDGTFVTLTVCRGEEEMELRVERGEVNVSFVNYEMLEENIGYLNLAQFTGGCIADMEEAIDYFKAQNVRGIVLDLRGNPGGLLDDAVAIADMLLPEGVVSYTEDRNGNRDYQYVDDEYWDIPMVVLVNGSSASASELFTAAFQDDERGTVVGTQTFGKGIMQTVVTFSSDGAGMQYTTARYFSPLGRCIHETGIAPDVVVESGENDVISVLQPNPETDQQLSTALDELEKMLP